MRTNHCWNSPFGVGVFGVLLSGCVVTLTNGDHYGEAGTASAGETSESGDTTGESGDTTGDTTGESGESGESGDTTDDPSTTGWDSSSSDASSDGSSTSEETDTSGIQGSCGDGIVDPGEACDDGDMDNSDACLTTCDLASCGDGYAQVGVEECDDGNDDDDDQCTSECVATSCEDGVLNGSEVAVDCGGQCPSCATGEACVGPTDCLSGACAEGICVSPRHCLDIRDLGLGEGDGIYIVDQDGVEGEEPPIAVYCEMSFEGGGWTSIFNRGDAAPSYAEAEELEQALATVAAIEPVEPWTESEAVHSGGLDLSLYHEVIFAWQPVDTLDPTRYAILSRDVGLSGLCMVDGPCPGATSLGIVDVVPSGETIEVFTGDPLHWPQVGLGAGVGDQSILWGFDRHASPVGPWGNWSVGGQAGLAGNTPEIIESSWRYSIYIR